MPASGGVQTLLIFAALFFFGGATDGIAQVNEFHVDLTRSNHVTFKSDAPIEDFEGVTDRIDGYVYWEGAPLSARDDFTNSELYLEVELNGLDTGVGLRNRHMRRNYLETDKHPYATYTATIASAEQSSDGGYRVHTRGTFAVHGVERPMDIPCDLSADENGYRVECVFQVLLGDHNIKIPSLMFMKLSETIQLELDFYVIPADENQ